MLALMITLTIKPILYLVLIMSQCHKNKNMKRTVMMTKLIMNQGLRKKRKSMQKICKVISDYL